jgi:hypothetical protein
MPSESETLWYLEDKPSTELSEPPITPLRFWTYEHGFGHNEFGNRYLSQSPFFFSDKPNYQQIWMALCELLFALRRAHDPEKGHGHGDTSNWWWNRHKDAPDTYLVYDEDDVKYGYVLYLDIEAASGVAELMDGQVALFNGKPVFRSDITMIFKAEGPSGGSTEAQAALQLGGIEADKSASPIEIPEFPKWSDKIKEKFHRSDDKDMSNWDNSLNGWQVELQIALAN